MSRQQPKGSLWNNREEVMKERLITLYCSNKYLQQLKVKHKINYNVVVFIISCSGGFVLRLLKT